jgi:hypothetical protein
MEIDFINLLVNIMEMLHYGGSSPGIMDIKPGQTIYIPLDAAAVLVALGY